MADKVSRSSF